MASFVHGKILGVNVLKRCLFLVCELAFKSQWLKIVCTKLTTEHSRNQLFGLSLDVQQCDY